VLAQKAPASPYDIFSSDQQEPPKDTKSTAADTLNACRYVHRGTAQHSQETMNPSIAPTKPIYSKRSGNGTMDINALVISGSDPGAVPGGSTKILY